MPQRPKALPAEKGTKAYRNIFAMKMELNRLLPDASLTGNMIRIYRKHSEIVRDVRHFQTNSTVGEPIKNIDSTGLNPHFPNHVWAFVFALVLHVRQAVGRLERFKKQDSDISGC